MMQVKLLLLLFGLLSISISAFCQPSSAADIAILTFPAEISSDSANTTNNWKQFSDLDYEKGFFDLSRKTPIDFDYNQHVKKHIDYYLNKRRDLLSKVSGLSKYYFPIFEEMLDKYNLPLELKYLAIIESALNPTAQSRTGAIGLWQFKYNTAKMMELVIDNYVDERQDPWKSTDAACRYLDFLYNTFGDWQLAIAAYNGGPGVVRNAIIRSGGKKQFWEIMPYLSEETRNYVPGFLAMAYILENSDKFGIVPVQPGITYNQVDTVMVSQPVSFLKVAGTLGIPAETIRFLNPSYKKNYIPMYDKPVPFVLPVSKIPDFVLNENNLTEETFPSATKTELPSNETKVLYKHSVEKGDYLNKIALKYRCSIDDIMVWNGMSSPSVVTGQELIIWIPESLSRQLPQQAQSSQNQKSSEPSNVIYTIKKGDNLYSISSKFNNVTVDEIKKANSFGDDYMLLPGAKIIIPQH